MRKYGLILVVLLTLAGLFKPAHAADPDTLEPTQIIAGDTAVRRVEVDDVGATLLVAYADGSAASYILATGERAVFSAVSPVTAGVRAEAAGTSITLDGAAFAQTAAPVRDIRLNAAASLLAAALDDGTVIVYDTASRTELATLEAQGDTLLFNPAGDVLTVDTPALNQVTLWTAEGMQIILPGQAPVRFSPDGTLIALVNDETTLTLRRMEDVLAREEDIAWGSLTAHYAAITGVAFTSDSALVATASRDGSISLWDTVTRRQIRVLMGHSDGVSALAFLPGDTQIASVDKQGALRLWDVATGAALGVWPGTGAPLVGVAVTEDSIFTAGQDGRVVVWSAGPAIELPEYITPSAATEPLRVEEGVHGNARRTMPAGAHPLYPVGCVIEENERVIALGQSAEGGLLLMAASCAGPVWTSLGTRYFDWQDRTALDTLPVIAPETSSEPRLRLTVTEQLCAAVRTTASTNAHFERPRALYPPDNLPAAAQATSMNAALTVICHDYETVPVENCHYLGPLNYSYIFTRKQLDDTIRLVDYASGQVIAQHRFRGAVPPSCPDRVTRGEVVGETAAPAEWVPWVLETAGQDALLPLRSEVIGQNSPVFSDPASSTALGTLSSGTPVTPVARSGQAWVLVLLPDMSEGWIAAENVRMAAQTPDLPETSRPAIASAPMDRGQQIARFAKFRPVGRVTITADQLFESADGFYIAAVRQQEDGTTLSLWDIRGGQQLWQVSLPDRQWEQVIFSPAGDTLLVKTNTPYPAQEEIRLTFYDLLTGMVVSETGDIDIIDSPVIPGSMPQDLNADPTYTPDGKKVVVDYWRRAEAPRCAVWQVDTAQLLWSMEDHCGSLSDDGVYMAVEQPYTALFSAYSQLAVYEVESGAITALSQDEVVQYRWLTDQTVFIARPYGEAPVIWHILDGTTAVVDLPQIMGTFLPDPLTHVMVYSYDNTLYVWDIATGELLGSSALQGTVVEQENRVIVLQVTQPADGDRQVLRAVDLENEEVLWESPWFHTSLSIQDGGRYAFAYNHDTQYIDLFDLQTGSSSGIISVTRYEFTLTDDWAWLIQFDGQSRFTVWGLPETVALFSDPPQIHVLTETQTYYEANTLFPYAYVIPPNQYLWVVERTEASDWVKVEDSYGGAFWLPTSGVEFLGG